MLNLIFGLMLLCQSAPKPVPSVDAIRLPEVAVPNPPPTPSPDAAQVLEADKYYVIDSDVECFVRTLPAGLVSVAVETGPIRLPSKSLVEGGKTKFKTFSGKYIYIIEAVTTGRCELLIVPKGLQADKEIVQRTIDALVGPRPPPDPPPGPKPDPTPVNPSPFVGEGLRCLIVYETADLTRMPAAQQQILFAKSIRTYLDSKSPLGIDGKTHDWRIYDQNIDTTADSQVFKDAMNRPRKSVPWIIVGNGKTGFEGPLPATVDDTLTLLRKYGG